MQSLNCVFWEVDFGVVFTGCITVFVVSADAIVCAFETSDSSGTDSSVSFPLVITNSVVALIPLIGACC